MLTKVGGLSPKVRIVTTTKVNLSTIHKVVVKVTKVTSVSSKVVKRYRGQFNRSRPNQTNDRPNINCFVCGKHGYRARDCPSKGTLAA